MLCYCGKTKEPRTIQFTRLGILKTFQGKSSTACLAEVREDHICIRRQGMQQQRLQTAENYHQYCLLTCILTEY